MSTVSLRCRCGTVRAEVRAVSPATVNRVICYCDDCQAFARFLDRADVLDAAGGTDIVQLPPGRITFTSGIDRLACVRLSGSGLFRWYTTCCKSPIGNMVGPALPFIGVIRAFMDFEPSAVSPDEVLGLPLASIFGKFAIGGCPRGAHPKAPAKLVLRAGRLMLGWWLRERSAAPFFDRVTRQPLALPRILDPAERRAVTA
jgi:hypothetical protein